MEQRVTTRELWTACMNKSQTPEEAKKNAETIKKIAGRVIWIAYSSTENPLPALVTSVKIKTVPNSYFGGLINLVTVEAQALGYEVGREYDDCLVQLDFKYVLTDLLRRVFMSFGEYRKASKEDVLSVSEAKYDTLAYEYEEKIQKSKRGE